MADSDSTGADEPVTDEPGGRVEARPADSGKAPSGRTEAFRSLARELTPEELQSPGVAKMMLNQLDQLESEREELRRYVERFHESDKLAAILQEQVKANRTIEVLVSVGLAVGGIIFGFVPYLLDHAEDSRIGLLAGLIGLAMMVLAVLARLRKL